MACGTADIPSPSQFDFRKVLRVTADEIVNMTVAATRSDNQNNLSTSYLDQRSPYESLCCKNDYEFA